jgi:nucleotide-binding universal stress UspA family protein
MRLFENMGVFLNDSPSDSTVLAFAARLAAITETRRIHCIHFRDHAPDLKHPDPSPEEFSARMRGAFPTAVGQGITAEVVPSGGVRAMLKSSRDLSLDLIVAGRRLPSDQMAVGSVFTRLARKAPCSVLVVTEQSQPHFERFLIPVDFSEHSKLSIEVAAALVAAGHVDNPQIVLQHNVEVGYGYAYAGLSFKEYAEKLEANAKREFGEFLSGVDLRGLTPEIAVTLSDRPAEAVSTLAITRKMDVVMLGSRGHSTPIDAILGSTAERILMACPLPIFIVKKKGETMRVVEALLQGSEE